MKIFEFGDNNNVSYTESNVTKSLDENTIEDLNNLHNNMQDAKYLQDEIKRNENIVNNSNSTNLQKKVAEDSIKNLKATSDENIKEGNSLLDKIKGGIQNAKDHYKKIQANKAAIRTDSDDPSLELLCLLLNQERTDEFNIKKGVKVPDEKTDDFIKDLSEVIDKPNDQKLLALGNKGYEISPLPVKQEAREISLNEDQALIIIAKDKNGVEQLVAFDNAETAMAKRNDAEFRNTYFAPDKETFAYSVSKQEFLANAMTIYGERNKKELVENLKSAKQIYHKDAVLTQSLDKGETKVIGQAKEVEKPTQKKYSFNVNEYKDCAINIDNVNWSQFERLGITAEDLHRKGQLKKLLNGEKTDLLLVRTKNNEGILMTGNFKFQLTVDDINNPQLMMSGVRSKLYIPDNFHGVQFSEEDKKLLRDKGTLYKEVVINNEKRLVYIDKQTNEICTRKTQDIIIPDKLRGRELSQKEKDEIKTGKPFYIKDFVSKEGKKYAAFVYINPEKNTLKVDFSSPLELSEKKNVKDIKQTTKHNKLSI